MARYLETAKQLRGKIESLAVRLNLTNEDIAELGLIVNLAVRCCPRACQSTVRRNIVAEATKGHCNVTMRLVKDKVTGCEFNAISVGALGTPKPALTEAADTAALDEVAD